MQAVLAAGSPPLEDVMIAGSACVGSLVAVVVAGMAAVVAGLVAGLAGRQG